MSIYNQAIFLFDDVQDHLQAQDQNMWDRISSMPFLAGADHVVVDTLEGFGEGYLNYLAEVQSLPRNLIVPQYSSPSLLVSLLNDSQALQQASDLVSRHKLDVCPFHATAEKPFGRLQDKLSSAQHRVQIHPSQASFSELNSKLKAREIFVETKVPAPIGQIVHNHSELMNFSKMWPEQSIILKKFHWAPEIFNPENPKDHEYPLVAELLHPIKSSIAIHIESWGNHISHMFSGQQIIRDWRNHGTRLRLGISEHQHQQMIDYSLQLTQHMQQQYGFQGACNIDFGVTADDQILVFDLNPRFGISSCVLRFMQRMGIDLNTSYLVFKAMYVKIPNLSAVLRHPDYLRIFPGSKNGMLLAGPSWDYDKHYVRYLFYAVVAETPAELQQLEKDLIRILDEVAT